MKRKEMEYILRQHGFRYVRCNKHLMWSNGIVTVALPSRVDYTRGLSRRILQQAGFDKQFIKEIV